MAKRASEEVLGELHDMVAQVLLSKLQSGEATPAEINAAIKFLQNNNIEAAMAQEDPALQKLIASLPKFDDEDGEYVN